MVKLSKNKREDSSMSESMTYFQGKWHPGNTPIMGAVTHATWMASTVFDGARYFEGVTPDLDKHCQRVIRSAEEMGFNAPVTADNLIDLAQEGLKQFAPDTALYIRPMLWAETGFVAPDPDAGVFCLTLLPMPMPTAPTTALPVHHLRRPGPETAPTHAKAACLYPQSGRALRHARQQGYENAVMADPMGFVAEFATANIFYVKDGVLFTPSPNQTFLNGITRQRLLSLLRQEGFEVIEKQMSFDELTEADEIFSSGNYAKVQPLAKYGDKVFKETPVTDRIKSLYWDFALSGAQ